MACTDRVCSTLWVALASGYNDRRTHDEACRSFKRSSLSEAGSGGGRFGYHSFASCRKAGFCRYLSCGHDLHWRLRWLYPSRHGFFLWSARPYFFFTSGSWRDGTYRRFRWFIYRGGYLYGWFTWNASEAVWRLRCRICHNNFDDERVSSYRAAYFRRVVQSCGDGQCVFR